MAQYEPRDGAPTTANTVTDDFYITFNNPCKTDNISLAGCTAGATALTTYSGGTRDVTAVTVNHSDSTCTAYQTNLVEVSANNGVNYYSSGTIYSDLISTSNTSLAFTLAPSTSTFDAGTADYTRKVRVTV